MRRLKYSINPALVFAGAYLGIDPGQVNMGVAVVSRGQANLFEIDLESVDNTIDRILAVTRVMQYVLSLCPPKINALCTEGAAYMAPQGQVPLETARTTATIAALQAGVWPAYVTAPKAVRIAVFGEGQLRSQEVWPDIPENAGSALGCAFFAYKTMRDEAKLSGK